MNLNSSDRKKLLALPFYMNKRSQDPVPRRGQLEYELFRELTGKEWNHYSDVDIDKQTKINEFEYEKFFSPAVLRQKDVVNSDEFKRVVRQLNYFSRTELEQHERN